MTPVQVEPECPSVSLVAAKNSGHTVSCSLGVPKHPIHSLQREASPPWVPSGTTGGSAGCSGGQTESAEPSLSSP